MASYLHGQDFKVREWNVHVKDEQRSSQATIQLSEIRQVHHTSSTPTHSHLLDSITT